MNQLSSQSSATTRAKPSPIATCKTQVSQAPRSQPKPLNPNQPAHASAMHALPTDVPQPRLRLEMCHSCGMVVDDSVVRVVGEKGAQQGNKEKELKGTKKKKKVTTPISATSNLWLDYSSPLQMQLCHNIDLICTIT